MKKGLFLIMIILMHIVIIAQNTDSVFIFKLNTIEAIIKQKENDKHQQSILISFRSKLEKNTQIRTINEYLNHYVISVSHEGSDEYIGGTEAYRLDKETGISTIVWHEHPMKIDNIQLVNNEVELKNKNKMKESKILGLRTTIYKVGNLKKAKKWYAAAFETEPYFEEAFYVGFNIGGYELGLLPEENQTREKVESVLTYWGVNEIEKVYMHFIESGATEVEKPNSVGGPLLVASVKDPWGNIIGLIYNPVFKLKE